MKTQKSLGIGLTLISIFYGLLSTFLANSFIFIKGSPLKIAAVILIYLFILIFSGAWITGSKSRRIRLCSHGCSLLLAFLIAAFISVIFHILLFLGLIFQNSDGEIWSAVFGFCLLFVQFWCGIISVYVSSLQLGIKWRLIGIILGLIPLLNLFALSVIIKKALGEVLYEAAREKRQRCLKKEGVCKTKYPLLMVHGVFFRDFKRLNYWGRIPRALELGGAQIFYGEHQSALSIRESGEELTRRIKEIVKETGCEKVNIIAHSKGGLDCRYAMANCSAAPYIASLTTVNTPHKGCTFADWLLKIAPEKLKLGVADKYNKAARLLGDESPDFLSAVENLTAEFCTEFDKQTPPPEGVFCQSVGSVMPKASSGKFPLNMVHLFVSLFESENDGLVSSSSFPFGEKFTLLTPEGKRGISHADMIDLGGENIEDFDVRDFYVNLVNDLKMRGF